VVLQEVLPKEGVGTDRKDRDNLLTL